ncbi:DUF3558 domain-containing protein [Saccharomonospora sp. NPDC046836]|uniref:DUF3558 domain-containing protein n=1 Tax=Saccharomonospora sp. NPDC046836 TaxID=3156921 RepID=UPI00340897A0
MSTRLDVLCCGAFVTLLLAGCTTSEVGEASLASTDAASPSLPAPPEEELPLAGVDPCSLFTEAQLDELKVNSEPRATQDGRDGPTCSLDVDLTAPYYSYYVEAITTADMQDWVDGERRNTSMTTLSARVAGIPALVHYAKGSSPSDCEVLVGVADGQTLRTQLYPTDPSEFSQEQMCGLATEAATLAVQTLKATR